MGTSNVRMEKQIKVLRYYKLYEDAFYSYFTMEKPLLIDGLHFYIVPKEYIYDFYETFNYNKNFDELNQLNIYCDCEEKTDINNNIAKDIIINIKKENEVLFKYNIGLKKIRNKKLINGKKNDNNYIFKLNNEGLFVPITYNIWDRFKRYYSYDIELKREGFSNNREVFIRTEDNRIDSFFIHMRTGDKIYHFCFMMEDINNFEKLVYYFKNNSVKIFLDKLKIKHIGEEIESSKFQMIEKIIPSDIPDIANYKVIIVYLDSYNFHDVEKKTPIYIKQDIKKSYINFDNDMDNNMNDNANNNKIDNKNDINFNNNNINKNDNYNKNKTSDTKKKFNNDSSFFYYDIDSNFNKNFTELYTHHYNNINNSKFEIQSKPGSDKNVIKFQNLKKEYIQQNKKSEKNMNTSIQKELLENSDKESVKLQKKDEESKNYSSYSSSPSTKDNQKRIADSGLFESISSDAIRTSYINLGNNSNIINAILQCLLNIKRIKNYLSNLEKKDNNTNLLNLIKYVFHETNSKGKNINNYLEKIYLFLQKNQFDKNRTKKILLLILNNLEDANIGESQNKINGDINKSKEEAYNLLKIDFRKYTISKNFIGIIKKIFFCEICKIKYYKFKEFKVISINVNDNTYKNDGFYLNFIEKLYVKNYIKKLVSKKYFCKQCKNSIFLLGKNIFKYCPEILIIYFNKKDLNDKKEFYIDLILDLDLNKLIENKAHEINYKYKLNSFIECDMKREEYISYLKDNPNWKKMDKKESIEIEDINNIRKICNPEILIYKKIE